MSSHTRSASSVSRGVDPQGDAVEKEVGQVHEAGAQVVHEELGMGGGCVDVRITAGPVD